MFLFDTKTNDNRHKFRPLFYFILQLFLDDLIPERHVVLEHPPGSNLHQIGNLAKERCNQTGSISTLPEIMGRFFYLLERDSTRISWKCEYLK